MNFIEQISSKFRQGGGGQKNPQNLCGCPCPLSLLIPHLNDRQRLSDRDTACGLADF